MSELQRVHTHDAPEAVGPYSQAIVVAGWVYSAGQIALDPRSMELVGTTVAEQTERIFANLVAVLGAAGSGLSSVVRTTVFLADMADFAAMNEVYAAFFMDDKPARTTVQAALASPKFLVEIEAVSVIAD